MFAQETYADSINYSDSDFAPILLEDLASLPPAVIITAEFDPLRDQGLAYAKRLDEAGVKVWYKCMPGQIHALIAADENIFKKADDLILSAMEAAVN